MFVIFEKYLIQNNPSTRKRKPDKKLIFENWKRKQKKVEKGLK
jgi:hypothetical protein